MYLTINSTLLFPNGCYRYNDKDTYMYVRHLAKIIMITLLYFLIKCLTCSNSLEPLVFWVITQYFMHVQVCTRCATDKL